VAAICEGFLSSALNYSPTNPLSAVRWLLETSTNPDVAKAAAGMVPLVQWPPGMPLQCMYAYAISEGCPFT